MENQRNLFTIALIAISAILYFKWLDFVKPEETATQIEQNVEQSSIPSAPSEGLPVASAPNADSVPGHQGSPTPSTAQLVTINTDLYVAVINTKGGTIERLELKKQPIEIDQPNQGYPLLKNTPSEIFTVEDGLFFSSSDKAPNHLSALYTVPSSSYELGSNDTVSVPLTWTNSSGQTFVKTLSFKRDSYIIDIDYQIINGGTQPLSVFQYAQFKRTEPQKSGGSFAQLPSYVGGAIYETEDKYQKVSFGDMADENYKLATDNGWVSMMQHYFVGVFLPEQGPRVYYSTTNDRVNPQVYRLGYKTNNALVVAAGDSAVIGNRVFLGPKEQGRLADIEENQDIEGLSLTVDFGIFTALSKPLFWVLDFFHNLVGNWGWSIVLTTLLIKLVFFPLSAKSYKSMAAMKKLQPRLKTLKERHKDDRQKFQMEMMSLYKKEKVNPAGGCLPILIQIPVFLAFYWALLESVEMRHAPFMLWLQDLSAPDPYYVLPILMGLTQFLMTKLNPAPMDDIQKKVMMFMPIVLTFLFVSFPQGLVLYWVVNNILTMAQQWYINRKYA